MGVEWVDLTKEFDMLKLKTRLNQDKIDKTKNTQGRNGDGGFEDFIGFI